MAEWRFPSNDYGENKGINDSGVAMFRGTPLKSLAREICQNSLDASNGGTTVVEFNMFNIPSEDIPGRDSLLDVFQRCLQFWNSVKDLTNHFLFGYSAQRSLFRNGIARLWWIGRFSYDASRQDPYELTKFLCKNQDYIESICGRNIFNNREIGLTVLSTLLDAEKRGLKIDREKVREVAKYANLLAGTYLLDSFDKEDILWFYERFTSISIKIMN